VRYCYVAHPWKRLRESRLEAQPAPALVAMDPGTSATSADDPAAAPIERPAVG